MHQEQGICVDRNVLSPHRGDGGCRGIHAYIVAMHVTMELKERGNREGGIDTPPG